MFGNFKTKNLKHNHLPVTQWDHQAVPKKQWSLPTQLTQRLPLPKRIKKKKLKKNLNGNIRNGVVVLSR